MKISIIGAGNVGASTAFIAALRSNELGISEIVIVDIVEKVPQGKSIDLNQCMSSLNSNTKIIGTNSYDETNDSDVVIITAGIPRKPGMSRDDLISTNAKIVKNVVENIIKHSSNPWIVVVTNPLDAMVFVAKETAKQKNSEKIIGMAGTLDSARMRYFIAQELNENVDKIEAMTLGSHGDEMVPLISMAKVEDQPLSNFMNPKKINEIIKKTQNGGAEIVNLLGTSAYYGPAAAIVEIIEAIDNEKIIAVSAEYGDIFIGVPVKLKNNKVEIQKEIMSKMSKEEKELFSKSVEHIRKLISETRSIIEE